MVFLVLIGYALLVTYEFVPLYKENKQGEFWVNAVLGVISLTIAVLLSLGIDLPSPAKPIENLIKAIFGR